MTIVATGPVKVQQPAFEAPPEWAGFTERGNAILNTLPTARSALMKHQAGKVVECDLEGRNILSSHRYHPDLNKLVNEMAGHGALQFERDHAAAYLLAHYLATAKKVR
jgi:hypothetical protein